MIKKKTCISTLALRNMIRPFNTTDNLLQQACPMGEVLQEVSAQMAELKVLKELYDPIVASA